jgi:DNA-binding transcriptional LysR family regulator
MHGDYHASMQPLATLARIDLNLLTVFRAVDEARHVTRAARLLGVSQPALSQALRRMREAFGDPIFVKTSRGMVLTPLAESIAVPIREALGRIERDVLERGPFRAAELARTFRIRSTDFLESLLVPPLLEVLETAASNVRLAFLPVGIALPKEELELGACDLAIAGFFGDLPDGYYQRRRFGRRAIRLEPHPTPPRPSARIWETQSIALPASRIVSGLLCVRVRERTTRRTRFAATSSASIAVPSGNRRRLARASGDAIAALR